MNKISVIIVEDSVFMRSVIRDILQKDPNIEIVVEAVDGVDALEKLNLMDPDVMTLDLEMPKKNGITVLTELRQTNKRVKSVIVSSYATENSEITLDCLKLGAVDFLLKPSVADSMTLDKFGKTLIFKIKAAAVAKTLDESIMPEKVAPVCTPSLHLESGLGVVIIGSSTGGPVALEKLLPKFEKKFSMPVLIAQHLPEQFVISLSDRIRKYCCLEMLVAKTNLEVKPGVIYFVPGGYDGTLVKNGSGKVVFSVVENTDEILTPSIDKLMLSAASIYKNKTIGVILTGMGKDGLLGAKQIKAEGGIVIAQDEKSSAIYGMAREVVNAGLTDFILPLDLIAYKLQELTNNG